MNAATTNPVPLWMKVVFGRHPKRTFIRLISMVFVTIIVFRFILVPIRVTGLSMFPTFKDGKVNLVNHLAYRWRTPQRGDVIAFWFFPENLVGLKRIVGLPGERVRVFNGKVYVNGQALPEPYAKIKSTRPVSREVIKLDEDEYYVIGDNRDNTVAGPVESRMIIGKVMF